MLSRVASVGLCAGLVSGLLCQTPPAASPPIPDWVLYESFFHHVAFDQLVTPKTHYISRATVDSFLRHPDVDPESVYVVRRNGNSWKFGGRRRRA